MLDKLAKIEERFEDIEAKLCDPKIISNREEFTSLSRERADLDQLVPAYREYKKLLADIEEYEETLAEGDDELAQLERLGEVVVGPELEPGRLVVDAVGCG